MWYSWKGQDYPPSDRQPNIEASSTHNLPTILNQRHTLYSPGSFSPLPPETHLAELWPIFLRNAHPLIKLFFDWEIAPIIQKLQANASALSLGEEALINGIRFVAVLTLTHDGCQSSLNESKHELLLQCQKSTEYVLTNAEYTETTDKRVLQAFILYIVSLMMCCASTPICTVS